VTALRFVQTPELLAPLAALPRPPDPAKLAALDAAVDSLPEGELRSALASLGRAMLSSPNQSRSS
jgi:hypothetical protein